jgi:hypothetical protein
MPILPAIEAGKPIVFLPCQGSFLEPCSLDAQDAQDILLLQGLSASALPLR